MVGCLEYIADLHIHSKYSRATSQRNDLPTLADWAKWKGIDILGTGDFTHPMWLREIKKFLREAGEGLYRLDPNKVGDRVGLRTYFLLSVEVSTVYRTEDGRLRKVHHVILAPNLDVVEDVNRVLSKYGNLNWDGRPQLKISSDRLVDLLTNIDPDLEIFPAHVWTPWFGVFGSKSGFDSLEECYREQLSNIHAIETGLSSDPPMNWRLSVLDKYSIVSFSDAHSPENLGREATVFSLSDEPSYYEIIGAIRNKKIVRTIEFYPEEGKYHYDGHRNCNIRLSPRESLRYNNICPVCHKPLTLGVEHRVEELADRPEGYIPSGAAPYEHLIPLREILSQVLKTNKSSKKVMDLYWKLVEYFGSEYKVLTAPYDDLLLAVGDESIAKAIVDAKIGNVTIVPGYDGVYGKILVGKVNVSKGNVPNQKTINEFLE